MKGNTPRPIASDGIGLAAHPRPVPLLVSVNEAADFLGVSASWLYRAALERRAPSVKLGRSRRFSLADLRRYAEQNRVGPETGIREPLGTLAS